MSLSGFQDLKRGVSRGAALLSAAPITAGFVCALAGLNLFCEDHPVGDPALARGNAKPRIGVSIVPQKYIVDAISGGTVAVEVLIPAGADPHMYEPGPDQLRRLSRLHLFFAQGLEFERVSLNRMLDLNGDLEVVSHRHDPAALQLVQRQAHSGNARKHDAHSSNLHGHNPHTWLSPRLVRAESVTILSALLRLFPEQAAALRAGHRELLREIDRVDGYVQRRLAPVQGRLLLVYHPSWEYFARDYGLRLLAVHADGHTPSPRDLMELVRISRAEGVRTIFAEPGFDRRAVEMLARDLGAELATIDPLAADWGPNLCRTADRIAGALAP